MSKIVNKFLLEGDKFMPEMSMKDFGVGLAVKSKSDLILKEIHGICEKKINKRRN